MKPAVLFLLLFIWAPVHAQLIELVCEHGHAKTGYGIVLEYSDSFFDLTIDMESHSVSSERYTNFRDAGVLVSDHSIRWGAPSDFASKGGASGQKMSSNYYLNRYTGTLKVEFGTNPDRVFEAEGQCIKKERLF